MVTIRCTQKLLRRVASGPSPPPSDTLLGDWYANVLFARPEQLILCLSERTLLPVVVTARAASTFGERLAKALHAVLLNLGVRSQDADVEITRMSQVAYGPTRNRRILGTMNSFMFQLSWFLHEHPRASLQEASAWLGETPCSPIKYDSPDRLTIELLSRFANVGAMVQ